MSTAVATIPTEPGIYRDLPFDDYARMVAANHSVLRHFRRSPAHALEAITNPRDQSGPQSLGWTSHVATLEPDRFEAEFIPAIRADKRTNIGKAAWAEFVAGNHGRTIVSQEDYDAARYIRDAVWRHPSAAEILRGPGVCELSVLWKDRATGVMAKGRIDRLGVLGNWPVVVDLKTTKDASRGSFARDLYSYGYHEQAAMYLDGLDAIQPHPRKFLFIAVESASPHCVAVYELEEDAVQVGRDEYARHLASYAECVRTGHWPGYGDGVDYVSLPPWAFKFHGEAA